MRVVCAGTRRWCGSTSPSWIQRARCLPPPRDATPSTTRSAAPSRRTASALATRLGKVIERNAAAPTPRGDGHLHPRSQAGDRALTVRRPCPSRASVLLHRALAAARRLGRGGRGRRRTRRGGRRGELRLEVAVGVVERGDLTGEVAVDVLGPAGRRRLLGLAGGGAERILAPGEAAARLLDLALLEEPVGVLERGGRLAALHAAADHGVQVRGVRGARHHHEPQLAAAAAVVAGDQIAVAQLHAGHGRRALAVVGDAHLEEHRLHVGAGEGAQRDQDLVARAPEAAVEYPVELHARRELDGDLGVAGDRAGEALGLLLEHAGEAAVVGDEVVPPVGVLGDGGHDLLVVVDVDADGRHAHPAPLRPLGDAAKAGDVAHPVVGVAVAEQDDAVDPALGLGEELHPLPARTRCRCPRPGRCPGWRR